MKNAPDPPETSEEGTAAPTPLFNLSCMTLSQDPPEMGGHVGIDPSERLPKVITSSRTKSRHPINDQKSLASELTIKHSTSDLKASNTSRKLRSSTINKKSTTSQHAGPDAPSVTPRKRSPINHQKLSVSQHASPEADGAMVLYERPSTASTPSDSSGQKQEREPSDSSDKDQEKYPSDSSNKEQEKKPSDSSGEEQEEDEKNPVEAIMVSEPRGMEVRTSNQDMKDYAAKDMRKGFNHCFVTVPRKERLSVLFATLRRSSERKVVVICSTWESAAFHALLFRQLEMLHIYELHECMKDKDVAFAYNEFLYLYPGILFASEIAMREFDVLPNVDYLIQYEPPTNPTEYIYRMSNAKVYRTSCHKALLFLTPDEMLFLEYFNDIENKELEARKVAQFQKSVEDLVTKHSELNHFAWRAFRAFMHAYENHPYSNVYEYAKIDEDRTRKSFGKPRVPEQSAKYFEYNIKSKGEKKDATKEKKGEGKNDGQDLKTRNWTDKEKTWRKGGKAWATREEKSWKHTHVRL
mmetsp:Transcript_17533/g.36697  ORF Transcript_17533/g.36697 Transcript_17533/m.36697 type:complete len:523 (+) Transcript_17533:100-1668(+)|eukprot:CAMPEP_0196152860 /NCGR_PEP_ID=MMETSP0910-20130528/36222_1 /TAXON_ID=49265 /ORGANISM="Thalassiosira rotula, Strain GSO102" /LENGTH=522 /DNA_ID=CAMNT_0041416543 /DNA_START=75 /DNA_END=1643 /DNA_ORIENTATION=-